MIPPSPVAEDPEAKVINWSVTEVLTVFTTVVVPLIVTLPPTVKSLLMIILFGNPIVTVCPDTEVSIWLVVPTIDNVWVWSATEPFPDEPEIFNVLAIPVNWDPSP